MHMLLLLGTLQLSLAACGVTISTLQLGPTADGATMRYTAFGSFVFTAVV